MRCNWCDKPAVEKHDDGVESCYDHCSASYDGEHAADATTVSHGGDDIIDVNCLLCGQSGSFPLPAINWG